MLQPLLGRTKVNKRLSDTERQFAAVMVPAAADSRTPLDENALILTYFFDDYLSAAIGKTAGQFGVPYLDMNAEIAGLGPEVEFYTDYCHLTPQGNQRVAEILARESSPNDGAIVRRSVVRRVLQPQPGRDPKAQVAAQRRPGI